MKPKRRFVSGRPVLGVSFRYGTPLVLGFAVWISGASPAPADILRGGSSAAPPAPQANAAGSGATPTTAEQSRANAQNILTRNTQAIQSVRAMQEAARAAAVQGPNQLGSHLPAVPNGLGSGGLQVAPDVALDPSLWQGAELPTETSADGKTQVTIKQTAQQALLNWQTFNIGKETTLTFDQSDGGSAANQWIAFNKIHDPTGNPTQILGSIQAQGQVYVINQNGIIFGGSSQVNVHTLTASALPINDNLVERGLLNNPDQQFLFSSLALPAGSDGTPAFVPDAPVNGRQGDVIVQAGATMATPVSADGNGGRILLVGANVVNEGTLSTPAGQTILAAGLQVGFSAHDSTDPSLRGLDVYIGAVVDPASALDPYAGTVTQNGILQIAQGSATLAGKAIEQLGVIHGTTSVSLNGRIDLLANYDAVTNPAYDPLIPSNGLPFLNRSTGSITLGSGSITQILPETESADRVVGSELALRSQVNLQGKTIYLAPEAVLFAPNAEVSLQAGSWGYIASSTFPTSTFLSAGGQVYLDTGSIINLAGTTDATASVLQNLLTLELRGSELAPAPLQRDGELRGDTIVVDLGETGTYEGRFWVGTPLADLTGYVGLIERDVAQLTTAGGTLAISAGDSVVLRDGSLLDVSGGWTNYTGATVTTSTVWSGGNLVDISLATPDQVYGGVYTGTMTVVDSKWGVVKTYAQPLAPTGSRYLAGYTQGADAGSISISAASMALDGSLLGTTVAGDRQVRNTPVSSNLPQAASLTLQFRAQLATAPTFLTYYPTDLEIVFQSGVSQPAVEDFALNEDGTPVPLSEERQNRVVLAPERLTGQGFGHLTVNNEVGSIVIPEGTSLSTVPGGSISLTASLLDVRGDVTAPGGSLSFTALNLSPYETALLGLTPTPQTPPPNAGRGIFTLAEGATLSTAGLVTDDRFANRSPAVPAGGTISITAYTASLAEGSVIDVSGGYAMRADGTGVFGDAGAIRILAGQDALVPSVLGGSLILGSELKGFAGVGAQAGTLAIQAPYLQIGGTTSHERTLLLDPSFFHQGGFGTFALSGLGQGSTPAVRVAEGTAIEPVVQSLAVRADARGITLDTFEAVNGSELPEGWRAPVSLSLSAPGVRDLFSGALVVAGGVVVEEGASLRVTPTGSVSLTGSTVTVLGSVVAPGGSITVAGSGDSTAIFGNLNQALATTYLGANSLLSTAGTVVLVPDPQAPFHRRIGQVLDGGTIQVAGNLVAAAGSVLDVSGTSGTLDLSPYVATPVENGAISPLSGLGRQPAARVTVPVTIESDAGSITLSGGQFLFSDATLIGRAGGESALGGTLNVSSGRFYAQGATARPSDISLVVVQDGPVLAAPAAGSPIGQTVQGTHGSGTGFFAVEDFAAGGFDSLSLGGVIRFSGDVDIQASGSISLADRGILFTDSALRLQAGYVAIGTAFVAPQLPEQENSPLLFNGQPYLYPGTYGSGTLEVAAGLIDVGSLTLQGIGSATLAADQGDIRGNGTFTMAGDLLLRAGQIYPTTASSFTVTVYDHAAGKGSITIQSSGQRNLPLSAGGTLGLYASTITQEGVLRAPFGTIHLGWDGTGTAPRDWLTGSSRAFPVTEQLTLADGSITSVSAVDPLTGKGLVIPYGISTDGSNWIDPRGVDITSTGPPDKSIQLAAANLSFDEGATIDLRGGGDLYAERWVSGLGGPVDILTDSQSFAILPDYDAAYAPYAAYNGSTNAANLIAGASGYTNGSLQVGDSIYLSGSKNLPAGNYTLLPARYALLPARYALLPGAVLVRASANRGLGTVELAEGASVVSGYRYNALDAGRDPATVATRFEVAPSSVVRARAQYDDFLANTFFPASAAALDLATPLLPTDAGYLLFQATRSMALQGAVQSASISEGRGAAIDISTQLATLVSATGAGGGEGVIALDSSALQSFGAESLLIGGKRTRSADGVSLSATTTRLTVDNAGSPLEAQDVILVSREALLLEDGAEVRATGTPATALDSFSLTGNGTLLRVSADESAAIVRSGTTSSALPLLTVGAGAKLSGGSIILDSSAGLSLDPTADLLAASHAFHSGSIRLILDPSLAAPAGSGLVLAGSALLDLRGSSSLSLLSYSSIDLYGSGSIGGSELAQLTLSANEIRGVDTQGGTARIEAGTIQLRGTGGAATTPGAADGSLELAADVIRLGAGSLALNQYETVTLQAARGILGEGTGGISAQQDLVLLTPRVGGAAGAVRSISAGGTLRLESTGPTAAPVASGLGSTLSLSAASIHATTAVVLPSGTLSLRATEGDLRVAGSLTVAGLRQELHDVTQFTPGGQILLSADHGNVILAAAGTLDVSAPSGGGHAGSLAVSTPEGRFTFAGTLLGQGGTGGDNGHFRLDAASLPSFSQLAAALNSASLVGSQSLRVREGDVLIDGTSLARNFELSADQGSITVTGTLDASGVTGGSIRLSAHGDVTLADGAVLTVAAQQFTNAGKGGSITLEAGSQRDGIVGEGVLDLQAGALLDLSVAAHRANSAALGQFTGKLHLRAPQSGSDLLVNPLRSTITGASSILVEGYRLYDLTDTSGVINPALQATIRADAEAFLGAAGDGALSGPITSRLLAEQPGLEPLLVLAPGVELIHREGNITLGGSAATATADWNLALDRYGEKGAPGVLTIRAAGNLVFYNALSDGFVSSAYTAPLLGQNLALPVNAQSWTYRLTSGADLSAAGYGQTLALETLAANTGSLQLGKNNNTNVAPTTGTNATTAAAVGNFYQVIRTGSGDIDIHAARSIQLLNHFATIYTAGTQVTDATLGGTFQQPYLNQSGGSATLGADQQSPSYAVQYSMAGGNVSLTAGENIEHLTRNNAGQLIADSQRQLPNNWLYRRGYVDPVTGQFGASRWGDLSSTTWWVDFSNFFQGIGALGGGDVTLRAGNNISNVDAVIPTNARMPYGTPNASALVELGGGDLTVRAGRNIDAGVYYVERGQGTLTAGASIVTNSTRSPSLVNIIAGSALDAATWLPTTLFLGKGSFDVSAVGDVLLGPVANPFLLPVGINNTYWQKSYFSTYAADSSVSVSSLGGDVTLRQSATLPSSSASTAAPLLFAWIQNQQLLRSNPASASFYQPWLRLAETNVEPFRSVVALLPGTLSATAFSGDINLVGDLTLSPSATGTLDLLAGAAINGLQRNGLVSLLSVATSAWGSSTINLSDADPNAIPGITSPYGYYSIAGNSQSAARQTQARFLEFIDRLFRESGGTLGAQSVLETKQALHAGGILHRNDTQPVRLYAGSGDISGLTLFSPKRARIIAGRDILDVALYLQNVRAGDVSLIASGRDIIPYSTTSPLRIAATRSGNITNLDSTALAGDLQISGPGVLQVLAGRNLDLGAGQGNVDGTGSGITSIGNGRNPSLPFQGADLIVGAGVGLSQGLSRSSLDLAAFIQEFVLTEAGAGYLAQIAPGVSFESQSDEEQARLALEVFYLILRDAGRNYPELGNYDSALAAIATLFGEELEDQEPPPGDIRTRSRDIRTANGGDISILAPGGGLEMANTLIGNPLSPPGIITSSGGNISLFARNDVSIGIGRIFTLRGGNEIIWSSKGDIAAGSSSKTVQSAPPTRVLIDPQSAAVQTDLAGLATGGGIGVLATVAGIEPGDVDLIAPEGTVDAGDAGIRVSGNLNIAANQVLNAGNIVAGGTSTGTPAPVAIGANVGSLTTASNVAAATTAMTTPPAPPAAETPAAPETTLSFITVEVIGYGGAAEEEPQEQEEDQPEENGEER